MYIKAIHESVFIIIRVHFLENFEFWSDVTKTDCDINGKATSREKVIYNDVKRLDW